MKRTCVGVLWSKRGSVHWEGCGVPHNMTPRDTVHLHRRPPPASTGSCSSSLHGLLFIHPPPRATPPATVQLPLHRLLFIQPSTPRGLVQLPLHGHPSTVYCSSSPPHHGVLFNHPSTGTPPPSTVHPPLHTTASCSSTPPRPPLHRL